MKKEKKEIKKSNLENYDYYSLENIILRKDKELEKYEQLRRDLNEKVERLQNTIDALIPSDVLLKYGNELKEKERLKNEYDI